MANKLTSQFNSHIGKLSSLNTIGIGKLARLTKNIFTVFWTLSNSNRRLLLTTKIKQQIISRNNLMIFIHWPNLQIERSRSRAAQVDGHRPTTLPRRKSSADTCSPGMFVKAHEQKKMLQQAAQNFSSMNFVQSQVPTYTYLGKSTLAPLLPNKVLPKHWMFLRQKIKYFKGSVIGQFIVLFM